MKFIRLFHFNMEYGLFFRPMCIREFVNVIPVLVNVTTFLPSAFAPKHGQTHRTKLSLNFTLMSHVCTATGGGGDVVHGHDRAGTGGGQSASAHRLWLGNVTTAHQGNAIKKSDELQEEMTRKK